MLLCSYKSLYESLQGNYEYNYNEFDYQRIAVRRRLSQMSTAERRGGVLRTHNSG